MKIDFFRENPAGFCKIKFVESFAADECIKLMDGRFFDSRKLKCFYWDGKTDYKTVRETKQDFNERVEKFGDWLEGQTLPEEFQIRREQDQQPSLSNSLK